MQCARSATLSNVLPKAARRAGAPRAVLSIAPPGRRSSLREASRGTTRLRAAINISDIPQEALIAAGGAVAAILGLVGYQAATAGGASDAAAGAPAAAVAAAADAPPPPPPRANAVLVLGSTGRLGRQVVVQLLAAGRTVVAAARSADKATQVLLADPADGGLGLKEGYQTQGDTGSGVLFLAPGVDVTAPETLTSEVFDGVTAVVSALGPVAGRLPDGSFGYIDGMSPDRVEAGGVASLVAAMQTHVAKQEASWQLVLPMTSDDDLGVWERLDDVIMGGSSSSGLSAAPEGSGFQGGLWKGDLIVEGGGFCGLRTSKLGGGAGLDLSGYDGLRLRVKGDGQTFKVNVKTLDQEDVPESTYQTTFDTSPEGDWTTVHLPWSSFVPVKRAQSDPKGAPLDPATISKLGLVLSRFEFNKMPNPDYHPGPFELSIDGGISAFKAPRPQLVVVSSAGVERNAVIGDDAEARKKDIPIVQLNPGGVLNYKYEAECSVRASGFAYNVIRCTGLDDRADDAAKPVLLEADQGDTISGRVSRTEAAQVVVAALSLPEAGGKTFELRRSEAGDAMGKANGPQHMRRLFLKLALDKHRWRVGLPPFPKAVPPPPPASEERKQEILADPRVKAVQVRDRATQQQQQPQAEEAAVVEPEKEVVGVRA